MGSHEGISRAEAKRTRDAVHAALDAGFPMLGTKKSVGVWKVAGDALGLSASGVRVRCEAIAKRFPDLAVDRTRERTAPADPIAALARDIELKRAQTAASEARSRLADAHKELARLQDVIADLRWASRATIAPAEWTLSSRRKVGGEHIPYLLTSDFQVGETIRPEETDHAHGYNVTIFRRRYRKLIDVAIKLCQDHTGSSWKFPGFIYARGGDAISGAIHDELAQTDDLTPLEAVQVCFEEEAAGIRHLAEAFGRVDVKEVIGNHGRTTLKPQSKRAAALNNETLISYMLQREFRADPRVTFQASESPDVFFPIYDLNVLLTHGDKIGSRGGQGFIGPAATMARGAQKVISEQQPLGRRVDRVDMGHFHTELYLGWLLANGCLPGYSEFAKMHRMRPAPPSQWLVFHHPRYGAVDLKSIVLEEPTRGAQDLPRRESKPPLIKPNAR